MQDAFNIGGTVMMLARQILVVLIFASFFSPSSAAGDQVRYYQENGITYCETRRTVQRPVCETTMQPTTRTVYKEQCYTETKDVTQVSWCPVTTYQTETYWVGRWNPFVEPYLETRWVPQTTWQQRTEVVKLPVTCRKLVPETQQVQVPVTTQKLVSEDVVVSRVAVSSPVPCVGQAVAYPAQTYVGNPGSISGGQQIGGIARLNQDPPRYGVGTTATVSPTR
ncbi:MAG: hypothetical protein ABSG67_14705 [Thermoguttaceae bacterium]